MPIQIMNNDGMNSKNVAKSVDIFNDSVAMNSIGMNGDNCECCQVYNSTFISKHLSECLNRKLILLLCSWAHIK